jgi:hypothetical protein
LAALETDDEDAYEDAAMLGISSSSWKLESWKELILLRSTTI